MQAPRSSNSLAQTKKNPQNQAQCNQKSNKQQNQKQAPHLQINSNLSVAKTSQTLKQQPKKVTKAPVFVTTVSKSNISNKDKQKIQSNLKDKTDRFKVTALEYEEFVKSSKPRINLIVVGHVDAGKSTLIGRFLSDLGFLSKNQLHRYETESRRSGKASFKYAWALDETNEERERGVTIDLAFTKFETKSRIIVVLDSPGHVDFIPAVISGAAQADAAILVVDASRGRFEVGFEQGGQTKEHALLVRSLGVKSLIVAINKMDMCDWDWNRYCEIKEKLEPFLRQVGFNMTTIQFIGCSGLLGENLIQRRQHPNSSQSSHPQLENARLENWRKMNCLKEVLDLLPIPQRLVDGPTRIVVNDVYKGMRSGVDTIGKVCGGKVAEKQSLLLLPAEELCEVKSVEIKDIECESSGKAFAGDIVALTTTGIDMNKYFRGCVLCDPSLPCKVTNRFQARIVMLHGCDVMLLRGSLVEVHINGLYEPGEIRRLVSLIDKTSGEMVKAKPKCMPKNSSGIIELKLSRQVCLELYSSNKELGRFMMRSLGKTVAAGLVTKIKKSKIVNERKMKSK